MTVAADILTYAAGGSQSSVSVSVTGAGVQPDVGSGYTVYQVTVAVSGLPSTTANIAYKAASGTELGTVVFYSGGHGTTWYQGNVGSPTSVDDWLNATVRPAGFNVILVQWIDGWSNGRGAVSAVTGVPVYTPILFAARAAALNVYLKLRYCGTVDNFIGVGNSSGSSLLAYCLTQYGLAYTTSGIFKRVVLGSGPPHAAMFKGGTGVSGYSYNDPETLAPDQAAKIDDMFGFDPGVVYPQGAGTTVTIAANLSSAAFATGTGTLNVVSSAGFINPPTGATATIYVASNSGTATVTYGHDPSWTPGLSTAFLHCTTTAGGGTAAIGAAVGFPGGPTVRQDATHDPGWTANAIDTGAVYTTFPGCTLSFVFGGGDTGTAPRHAWDWIGPNSAVYPYALTDNPSVRLAGGATHFVPGDTYARTLLYNAIVGLTAPGIRQQATTTDADVATTRTATFPYTRGSTSGAVAIFRAGVATASLPDQFTQLAAVTFGTTRCLYTWQSPNANAVTVVSPSGVGIVYLLEIDGFDGIPTLDLAFTGTESQTNVSTYTIGPTSSTVTITELALAILATSGGNFDNVWNNGYTQILSGAFGLDIAAQSLAARGAQTTTETIASAVRAVGMLLTWRGGPPNTTLAVTVAPAATLTTTVAPAASLSVAVTPAASITVGVS